MLFSRAKNLSKIEPGKNGGAQGEANYTPEGQDPVVLEDNGGRNLLADNFVEDGAILRVPLTSVGDGVPPNHEKRRHDKRGGGAG